MTITDRLERIEMDLRDWAQARSDTVTATDIMQIRLFSDGLALVRRLIEEAARSGGGQRW